MLTANQCFQPYTLHIDAVFKGNVTAEQKLIPQKKSDVQEAASGFLEMRAWGRRRERVWLEAEATYRAASSRLAVGNHLLIQFIKARPQEWWGELNPMLCVGTSCNSLHSKGSAEKFPAPSLCRSCMEPLVFWRGRKPVPFWQRRHLM